MDKKYVSKMQLLKGAKVLEGITERAIACVDFKMQNYSRDFWKNLRKYIRNSDYKYK
jgi:hypothetical protein